MAQNMVDAGRRLCAGKPWARFERSDAMALLYADGAFDAVVSTQVYEYVPELEGAVSEFGRVLRKGGCGVIVDTDWSIPYWSATDAVLRDRIIEAWGQHCVHKRVPMRLPGALRSAGLQVTNVSVLPLLNTNYNSNYNLRRFSAIGYYSEPESYQDLPRWQ